MFELETKLADLLRYRTVSVLKSNLTFFLQLDSAILHTLCEKESGNFYSSLSDRLESMLKFDEYAGVPEILGIVYGSNCPIHIYHESNGKYVCGMKYGDDTFPSVEPMRLLYSSDTAHSPGHYYLLVNQNNISTTHTVTSTAMNPQSFFDTWRNLCKTCSFQQEEPNFNTVFSDRNEHTSPHMACTTENSATKHPSNHSRTLSEANIDFSLPHKTPNHSPRTIIDFDQTNAFEKLNLNDFTITDTEQKSLDNLMTLCERHDMQWALLSKKGSTSAFVSPSLKKSLTLQELERKTEPSNIVYLRVFKDPADNGDTMQKILDFLSELFQVGKRLQY